MAWHGFNFIPAGIKYSFIPFRKLFFLFSALLIVGSLGLYFVKGLNYGIDFKGGILIEVRTAQTADLPAMRNNLNGLDLGDVSLQEFGADDDVLIRVPLQSGEGGGE
ncbi:MAG: protein translocase subunit SecF, partial [Rhodospirillales bacterium]